MARYSLDIQTWLCNFNYGFASLMQIMLNIIVDLNCCNYCMETDTAKETRKILRIARKEADEVNEEAERQF